jgi:hypothetical protein
MLASYTHVQYTYCRRRCIATLARSLTMIAIATRKPRWPLLAPNRDPVGHQGSDRNSCVAFVHGSTTSNVLRSRVCMHAYEYLGIERSAATPRASRACTSIFPIEDFNSTTTSTRSNFETPPGSDPAYQCRCALLPCAIDRRPSSSRPAGNHMAAIAWIMDADVDDAWSLPSMRP